MSKWPPLLSKQPVLSKHVQTNTLKCTCIKQACADKYIEMYLY